MTDGWEQHHDDPGEHHLPETADDPGLEPIDLGPPGDDDWDVPEPYAGDHDAPAAVADPAPAGYGDDAPAPAAEHAAPVAAEPLTADPVGADPDAAAEPAAAADVFPPALDVGPLPEPVDGFPWIDTGSLGVADIAAAQPSGAPTAADLAAHAAVDLPPGVDPWAHLAASDDPATAALARFYRPGGAAG